MIQLIFVYGTLKVGGRNAGLTDRIRTIVRTGTIHGELYSTGFGYPAAFNIDKTEKLIVGEVHSFTDIHAALDLCDKLEGYIDYCNPANLYNRTSTQCRLGTGELVECWVYETNRDVSFMQPIESGVF